MYKYLWIVRPKGSKDIVEYFNSEESMEYWLNKVINKETIFKPMKRDDFVIEKKEFNNWLEQDGNLNL